MERVREALGILQSLMVEDGGAEGDNAGYCAPVDYDLSCSVTGGVCQGYYSTTPPYIIQAKGLRMIVL